MTCTFFCHLWRHFWPRDKKGADSSVLESAEYGSDDLRSTPDCGVGMQRKSIPVVYIGTLNSPSTNNSSILEGYEAASFRQKVAAVWAPSSYRSIGGVAGGDWCLAYFTKIYSGASWQFNLKGPIVAKEHPVLQELRVILFWNKCAIEKRAPNSSTATINSWVRPIVLQQSDDYEGAHKLPWRAR